MTRQAATSPVEVAARPTAASLLAANLAAANLVAASLFAASLAACGSSDARDARATLKAIDALRQSAPESRVEALATLEALHPALREADAARSACAAAYRSLEAGKLGLAVPPGQAPDAASLVAAGKELELAERHSRECSAAVIALERWLGH